MWANLTLSWGPHIVESLVYLIWSHVFPMQFDDFPMISKQTIFPWFSQCFSPFSSWFSQGFHNDFHTFLAISLKGFPAINSHGAVWHRGTSLGDFLPMVFPRIFPHDISSQPTSRSLRPRPSASSSTAMAIIRRWSRLRREPSDVFSGEGNQNYRNPPHLSWENHGFPVKLFPPIQWFSRSWLGGWDHVEYRWSIVKAASGSARNHKKWWPRWPGNSPWLASCPPSAYTKIPSQWRNRWSSCQVFFPHSRAYIDPRLSVHRAPWKRRCDNGWTGTGSAGALGLTSQWLGGVLELFGGCGGAKSQ